MADVLTPKLGLTLPDFDGPADERVLNTNFAILDDAVTNANLPAAVGGLFVATAPHQQNLLTNPGLEVWQRGPGPFVAGYTADRWQIAVAGGSALSVAREAVAVANGSRYAAGCTYTHVGSGALYQALEDVYQLRGRRLSFSVTVQAAAVGTVRARLYDPVTGYTDGAVNQFAGVPEVLSVRADVAGTATAVQVHVAFLAGGTYYVDNAAVILGVTVPTYAPLHPADDAARCLRYYEVIGSGVAGELFGAGQATGAGAVTWTIRYATKAVAPTVTLSAPGHFGAQTATAGATNPFTGVSALGVGPSGAFLAGTGASGLVAGNASLVAAVNTAARIVVEANPA